MKHSPIRSTFTKLLGSSTASTARLIRFASTTNFAQFRFRLIRDTHSDDRTEIKAEEVRSSYSQLVNVIIFGRGNHLSERYFPMLLKLRMRGNLVAWFVAKNGVLGDIRVREYIFFLDRSGDMTNLK